MRWVIGCISMATLLAYRGCSKGELAYLREDNAEFKGNKQMSK
jgi:hypothetical protein